MEESEMKGSSRPNEVELIPLPPQMFPFFPVHVLEGKAYMPLESEASVPSKVAKKQNNVCSRLMLGCCTAFCCLFFISIAFVLAAWSLFTRCHYPPYSSTSHYTFSPVLIQSFSIVNKFGDLEFVKNPDTSVRNITISVTKGAMTSTAMNNIEVRFIQSDNTVSLHVMPQEFSWAKCPQAQIRIEFPDSMDLTAMRILAHSEDGKIAFKLDDSVILSNLSLSIDPIGIVDLSGLEAKSIEVVGGAAVVSVQNVRSQKFTSNIRKGKISVEDSSSSIFDLKISEQGKIELDNLEMPQLASNPADRKSTMKFGSVKAFVKKGEISVEETNSGDLDLTVEEGDIDIRIKTTKFSGSYELEAGRITIKAKNEASYYEITKSDSLKTGMIGHSPYRTQTIAASVDDGEIQLKLSL